MAAADGHDGEDDAGGGAEQRAGKRAAAAEAWREDLKLEPEDADITRKLAALASQVATHNRVRTLGAAIAARNLARRGRWDKLGAALSGLWRGAGNGSAGCR